MDNQVLLQLAKDSILSNLDKNVKVNKDKLKQDYPYLNELAASFVTINLNGKLRGCVGTLEARHSLLDDLSTNAKNAAFYDPRFYPLSYEEYLKCDIEISLLTKPEVLNYENIDDLKSKIKPYVHGVIISQGEKRATFLPQVWEQLRSFDEFFTHLCSKGNFEANCLENRPDIFIYEVQKIK